MVMHHHARKRRDRLQENLQQMKADGLMSAEGILDHPALFLLQYGTDPERPVTVMRLSDKMRQLVTKLWTLALKEVNMSKVDTKKRAKYNAKLQKSSSIISDQVMVTLAGGISQSRHRVSSAPTDGHFLPAAELLSQYQYQLLPSVRRVGPAAS